MPHILIVEDESQMRPGLKDNLELEGYEVSFAEDGKSGVEKILSTSYDLIILDVMLPKMSGFDICKKVRRQGIETPIIMLTAKGEEIDKVLGLEIGADDYITKPFSLRELLARIKAILRRYDIQQGACSENEKIKIGNLEICFNTYEAFQNRGPVKMTHKEIEILKYFWQNKNKVISRDDLLNKVWGYDEMISTRTIDNFIVKLRRLIEDNPSHPKYIISVHGVGYKLVY